MIVFKMDASDVEKGFYRNVELRSAGCDQDLETLADLFRAFLMAISFSAEQVSEVGLREEFELEREE